MLENMHTVYRTKHTESVVSFSPDSLQKIGLFSINLKFIISLHWKFGGVDGSETYLKTLQTFAKMNPGCFNSEVLLSQVIIILSPSSFSLHDNTLSRQNIVKK